MFELPLFPLNTVLFPSAPLHLHIFEERYKQMIGMCIQEKRPFGVVLIRQGVEAHGPLAEPYEIGCSAQIIHMKPAENGRMNIIAVGVERFRILSIERRRYPYLVGLVEHFPLANPHPDDLIQDAQILHQRVTKLIKMLSQAGSMDVNLEHLPHEPVALAYFSAALLQTPSSSQQALLSLEQASDLMAAMVDAYRHELILMKLLTKEQPRVEEGSFSVN